MVKQQQLKQKQSKIQQIRKATIPVHVFYKMRTLHYLVVSLDSIQSHSLALTLLLSPVFFSGAELNKYSHYTIASASIYFSKNNVNSACIILVHTLQNG